MAFRTVGEVIGQVRVLLQDEDAVAYRYSTASLVQALNSGLLETKRLRPDIYRHRNLDVPQYTETQMTSPLDYEPMYIPGLVNYVVGLAQLRDGEETTDSRAATLINTFISKLVSVA